MLEIDTRFELYTVAELKDAINRLNGALAVAQVTLDTKQKEIASDLDFRLQCLIEEVIHSNHMRLEITEHDSCGWHKTSFNEQAYDAGRYQLHVIPDFDVPD